MAPRLTRNMDEVRAFLEKTASAPFLALDTETTGLDPHLDRILLVQIGTAEQQLVIDVESLDPETMASVFRPDRLVVFHNAPFDLKMLWARFPNLPLAHARIADTQAAERLLLNGRRTDVVVQGFALKTLAERYAGMELDKTVRDGFMAAADASALGEAEIFYAARDVEATWKVFAKQLPLIERDGLRRVLAIEGAAAVAFTQLELVGAPLDAEAWRHQLNMERAGAAEARRNLDRAFVSVANRDLFGGTTLNYDNDQEVLDALRKLGVRLESINREALRASGHPAALAIAEYREHQKVVSTYGEGFLAHVHRKTKRLHPRFKSLGAITGRASCSDPNLQNIPAESVFRSCFRAPEGRRLITADYSAAELRILAEMSRDPVFINTLGSGGDLHAIVAQRLFKRPVSKSENPELRARAKAINFGLAYGMGAAGLAAQIGATIDEAERLLEGYFRAFPKIRGFLEDASKAALKRGVAETLAGRRYWFTDMRREGKDEGSLARIAKNLPIQGTNADITKLAMARMVAAFAEAKLDATLVNMVHDELVVECAADATETVREVMVREMMSAGAELVRVVPMTVEAHVGEAWSK